MGIGKETLITVYVLKYAYTPTKVTGGWTWLRWYGLRDEWLWHERSADLKFVTGTRIPHELYTAAVAAHLLSGSPTTTKFMSFKGYEIPAWAPK